MEGNKWASRQLYSGFDGGLIGTCIDGGQCPPYASTRPVFVGVVLLEMALIFSVPPSAAKRRTWN
jgi:hypothetical protein